MGIGINTYKITRPLFIKKAKKVINGLNLNNVQLIIKKDYL